MSDWRPVQGWPHYEVSRSGELRRTWDGLTVGQWTQSDGYRLARFSRPRAVVRVHRVVAEAFVPNPFAKKTVNHLNCNRSDNRAENLEWCSQAENLAHSERLGRMCRNYWKGKRSPTAKLRDEQVVEARMLYSSGAGTWEELARRFGLSKRAMGRCLTGETYALPAPPQEDR